jgi:8-oxo-dGTP pyrophosphatase MutT (NUDIX family)
MLVRHKLIVSIYLILIQDEKVLLLRRFNTGYEDGKYCFPAGHLEPNESIAQGLQREVKEEVGIDIRPRDATLVHTMHRKESDERVDFFFTVSTFTGVPRNCEPDKCDDVGVVSSEYTPREHDSLYSTRASICAKWGAVLRNGLAGVITVASEQYYCVSTRYTMRKSSTFTTPSSF